MLQGGQSTFRISGSDSVDAISSDDSIAITAFNLGPVFPKGLVIVEDGKNNVPDNAGYNNYKFIFWKELTKATSMPLLEVITWAPRRFGKE